MQDRDGALLVLNRRTRRFFPFIKCIFADAAYQGPKTATAIAKTGTWKLAIVKRDELHRFLVLPKRWIVERSLDQPQSAPRPRLRALYAISRGVHPSRNDPHHGSDA
jgi:transposase